MEIHDKYLNQNYITNNPKSHKLTLLFNYILMVILFWTFDNSSLSRSKSVKWCLFGQTPPSLALWVKYVFFK